MGLSDRKILMVVGLKFKVVGRGFPVVIDITKDITALLKTGEQISK